MPSFWLASFLVVAVLTAGQVALVILSVWENRRFAASRLRRKRRVQDAPRVVLFAPCKGLDTELKENLRPLLQQDYSNYEVAFLVESDDDPACATIRELIAEHHLVSARLLVTGVAADTGQKVHNLRVGAACLRDQAEVLAFVDSDARPRANWLRCLVDRLERPDVGAVTGYRWFVPARNTLSNLLSYSINSSLAAGLGPGGHHLIWGGSWAIRRDVFDAVELDEAWYGTLSDDLVATRVLQQAGLRIEFEPCCMIASPIDNGWRPTLSFIRRQYVIGRSYLPYWWALAMLAATLPALTFWGGLVLLAAGVRDPWDVWVAAICLAFYGTTVVRAGLRYWLARLYLPEYREKLLGAWLFDAFAGPLAGLANWLLLISSLVGRNLTWRGIRYHIERNGRVQIVQPAGVALPNEGEPPLPVELLHPTLPRNASMRPAAAPTSSTAA